MGKPSKRQKPIFAINVISSRKALGWNGHQLAEAAKIPYPTLRDIEAGISPGLEETKIAIARALGKTLSDLYAGEAKINLPHEVEVRRAFRNLAKQPATASVDDLRVFLEHLQAIGVNQRSVGLALLAGDYEVAKDLVSEDCPDPSALIKAL